MIAIGMIPARYAASRLPGKPLLPIAGKPMIQHVYERARGARTLSAVLVATDDERIAAAVRAFGGKAVLTSPEHRSGSDRLAEAARDLAADVIVNIQGDEPLVSPETIDALVTPFAERPELAMATIATPILRQEDATATSVVKVVVDREGYALYFSRLPIPFYRDDAAPAAGGGCAAPGVASPGARPPKLSAARPRRPGPGPQDAPSAPPAPVLSSCPLPRHWRHMGMYAYRKEVLMRFASLPPTPLEQAESLEQLRALEHGVRILVVPTMHDVVGVDTPEDLERVRRLMSAREP